MDIREFADSAKRWDKYFYDIAHAVAENSKCLSRKIGAAIVWNNAVLATGYNGPPAGVRHCDVRWENHGSNLDPLDPIWEEADKRGGVTMGTHWINECPRRPLGFKSGEGIHLCPAGHAERNAIANAAKNGVRIDGATMYMTCPPPCKECMISIINAGIAEIVVVGDTIYDELTNYILRDAKLKMRTYKHLEGTVKYAA